MKSVQGLSRSYQLVRRTKRKDFDGVIYLVAGESNIWVKLLKDRSAQKEMEVRSQLRDGYGSLFEIPLDIVMDSSGFAGYTFRGQEMDVVPEKQEKIKVPIEFAKENSMDLFLQPEKNSTDYNSRNNMTTLTSDRTGFFYESGTVFIGLVLWGLLLFAANYFLLNKAMLELVFSTMGDTIGYGCVTFGMEGLIPGILGITVVITILKRSIRGIMHVALALLLETLIFLLGVLAANFLIAFLVMILLAVVGTVQRYMSTIITVGVIIFIAKIILKK